MTKAYAEGWLAFRIGEGCANFNPYEPLSKEWEDWVGGWVASERIWLKNQLADKGEDIAAQVKELNAENKRLKRLLKNGLSVVKEAIFWDSHDDEGEAAIWLEQADEWIKEAERK